MRRRSTLLRAIGEGLVVGFPKNIRALYVDQLEGGSEQGSVLQTIMAAEKDVVRWRQQAALLQVPANLLFAPALYMHAGMLRGLLRVPAGSPPGQRSS